MLTDKEKLFYAYFLDPPVDPRIFPSCNNNTATQHDTISRNNVRARVYVAPHKKNIVLIIVKMIFILKYCRIFASQTRKTNNTKNLQL